MQVGLRCGIWGAVALALSAAGAGALTPGDIAIVGYNGEDTDSFGFVNLAPISDGTRIDFYATNSVYVTWVAPAGGLAAGTTVIAMTPKTANYPVSVGSMTNTTGTNFNYKSTGDSLVVRQGTTNLFVSENLAAYTLPTGLAYTNGTAINHQNMPGSNNGRYRGTRTGTRQQLLAAIADTNNWEYSTNATAYNLNLSPYNDAFVITSSSSNLVTWTGTVWDGYRRINNRGGGSALSAVPAVDNIRSDNNDALSAATCYAVGGGSTLSGIGWLSVYFTNDLPSGILSSVRIRAQCQGAAGSSGTFAMHISTNRNITNWKGNGTAAGATNSPDYAWNGTEQTYLYDVTSVLNTSAKITNCEVLFLNKGASNLYFDVAELLVDIEPVGAPVVENAGATGILPDSATLNGRVISGGPNPDVFLCWGDNDGGTNRTAWDTVVPLGALPIGVFSSTIAGLTANGTYFFRYFATNSYGSDWADLTASFAAAPPTVQFAATDSTSSENVGTSALQVVLSQPSAVPVVVTYSLAGGSATAGADYSQPLASIVIPAGSVTSALPVAITDDVLDEFDETAIATLTGATNATLGDIVAHTLTIADDDAPPSVAFSAGTFSGAENGGDIVVTAQLAQVSGKPIQISCITSNGTAVAPSDFAAATGTLFWAAGETEPQTFSITPANDSEPEQTESFYVTLADPSNCMIGAPGTAQALILDDDFGPPTVSSEGGISSVTSNSAFLRGTLVSTGGQETRIRIYYGTSDGGTVSTGWPAFRDLGPQPNGVFGTNVTGLASNTTYYYRCSASNLSGVAWSDSAAQFLTGPPSVCFSISASTQSESVGTATLRVQIQSPSAYGVPVTVNCGVVAGTATPGEDVLLNAGTVTIPAETNDASVSISVISDSLDEFDETVVVALSNAVNARLTGPSLHTLTLVDDDPLPAILFTGTPYSVSESGGAFTGTVVLATASGRPVQVGIATANGTAMAGTHYTAAGGTVSWQPGDTSARTLVVPIVNDTLSEGSRTFFVALSSPSNATVPVVSETVTIVEDDVVPPLVDNGGGASNIAARSATLNGTVVTGVPPPRVTIYWGRTDGGTNRIAWSNAVDMSVQAGSFSYALTGLQPGTSYYYRCYATNAGGQAWASSSASFATPAARDYYVNDQSTSGDVYCGAAGSDAYDGLTPATPRPSIQAILDSYDLGPGDTVFIDTGEYSLTNTLIIAAADTGSNSLPVVLLGSTNGTTLARNDEAEDVISAVLPGGGYLRFENLVLTAGRNGLSVSGSDASHCREIQVVNCRAIANAYAGEGGFVFKTADSVLVQNSAADNNGQSGISLANCTSPTVRGSSCMSNVYYGIQLSYVTGATIAGGRFAYQTDWYSSGIMIVNGSAGLIESNECFQNGWSGLSYQPAIAGTVRNNRCYSNNQFGVYVSASGTVLSGNEVFDNLGHGVYFDGGSGHIFRGNLLHGNSAYAVYFNDYNNVATLDNNTLCGGAGVYAQDPQRVTVSNTIITADGPGNAAIFVATAPVSGRYFRSDYNNLIAYNGATIGRWGATACAALGNWRTASSNDLRSISADPLFVSPSTGDYHLQSRAGSYHDGAWLPDAMNSPCIDAGNPWADFSLEPSFNGLWLNMGADGNSLQASKTFYEGPFYSVTLATNPPQAGAVYVNPRVAQYPTNRPIVAWAVVTNGTFTWRYWTDSLSGTAATNLFYAVSNMTATAVFGGQLTPLDLWMAQYNLTDPDADPDHDGLTTREEFYAGTQPTNAASEFAILSCGARNGSNFVSWYGSTNSGIATPFVMYRSSNTLFTAPVLVATNIPRDSTGTNVWWTPQPTGAVWFFRPAIPTGAP